MAITANSLRLFADRAASTLSGGISASSVTITLTAGGGALFPNPTGSNFFAATLIDAATGLLDEIVWCTARSTDTLTVIRGQENTDALAFNAGDLFQKLLTSGDMEAMLQLGQGGSLFVPLIQQTTFFVNNSTGSNTFDGTVASPVAGTLHGPFASLSGAISNLQQFNLGGNTVTLQLATTGISYVGPGAFSAPSNGTLVVQGNASSQSSVVIQGASGVEAAFLPQAGTVQLIGVTVEAGTGSTAAIWVQTAVTLQNVTIEGAGAVPNSLLIVGGGNQGGVLNFQAGNIFEGNASQAILIQNGGFFGMEANGSVTGSPTYPNSFIVATDGAGFAVNMTGLSWSGSASGPHFDVSVNAYINTGGGGADFFPGVAAGVTSTGGQYL
jgi:hypothetical protein